MNERIVLGLDLATGRRLEQRTTTSGDCADLAERMRDLRALASEQLPGEPLGEAMAVFCDGCGTRVDLERPELPPDWKSTASGDFCPACVKR